jgi:hypothetical protein
MTSCAWGLGVAIFSLTVIKQSKIIIIFYAFRGGSKVGSFCGGDSIHTNNEKEA